MKECRYCGSFYEDSLSSCPNCGGSKVVTAEEKVAEEKLYIKEIQNQEKSVSVPADEKKNNSGTAIVLGILAIVVVIGIVIFGGNGAGSSGQTKAESNEAYEQGVFCYNSGDYENAIMMLSAVAENSKHYDEAQEMLATASANYSADIISKASAYVEKQEYEVALSLLENALSVLPEDTALQNALNRTFDDYKKLVCGTAIAEADTFITKDDYPSAIKVIDNAVSLVGYDDELVAKRGVYVDAYVSQIVSTAKAQYSEYDYEHIMAAKDLIENALDVVVDNSVLLDELDFYKTKLPVDIMSVPIDPYFDDDLEAIGEISDNKGTLYTNAIHLKYSTKIEVDYQYTKLTGIFFQSQKYASSPIEHTLVIYGSQDGRNWDTDSPLWSGKVSGNSNALSIDIDVSEWKYLVFQYRKLDTDSEYHCYMANMYLWK